jgi:hypothetical protein
MPHEFDNNDIDMDKAIALSLGKTVNNKKLPRKANSIEFIYSYQRNLRLDNSSRDMSTGTMFMN